MGRPSWTPNLLFGMLSGVLSGVLLATILGPPIGRLFGHPIGDLFGGAYVNPIMHHALPFLCEASLNYNAGTRRRQDSHTHTCKLYMALHNQKMQPYECTWIYTARGFSFNTLRSLAQPDRMGEGRLRLRVALRGKRNAELGLVVRLVVLLRRRGW